jgi:hypothetical protein
MVLTSSHCFTVPLKTMLERALHSEKALSSMVVTLSGMVTLTREGQT